jgi:hypothetical protein
MAEEGKLDPVVGRERNRTCFSNFEPSSKKTTPVNRVNLSWKISKG